MAGPDEVTIWKAPQAGRRCEIEIEQGFDPQVFPGDGPYFTIDPALLKEFQDTYRNGRQEINMPKYVFELLLAQGIIKVDALYREGRSYHVPAVGLHTFNEAILQGSPNRYYPQEE